MFIHFHKVEKISNSLFSIAIWVLDTIKHVANTFMFFFMNKDYIKCV